MPDQRKHRGPHPGDRERFSADCLSPLRHATADLGWLLSHGYAINSSLKLVGDRYALDSRQRLAVGRCACSDSNLERRRSTRVPPGHLVDRELWIDGFNVLTTVEAALSSGPLFHARDDCFRDMASMHGSYRKVTETRSAICRIGQVLAQHDTGHCHWLLDQPVSNSGRLKTILGEISKKNGWDWSVELVADPDVILKSASHVVATADSGILDCVDAWFNLARSVIEQKVSDAWIVDLSDSQT